jgi:tetratricopeptide repeat protein
MVCPSCSTDNVYNFKFCPECGRRLAAVVSSLAAPASDTPSGSPSARLDEAAQAARLLEQGFERYDEGKYDEALSCCQAALALDPSGTTAHSLLGMIYERMGKTAEAVQQYQLVLRMNPDSIADAIKLETLVGGQTGSGRRGLAGLTGWRRRVPAAAGAVVAATALVAGVWATSRAVDHVPGRAGKAAARSIHGPVPGPSLPPSSAPPAGMPGAAAESPATARGAAPGTSSSGRDSSAAMSTPGTGQVAALPAPPPPNAWPGLRGAYPPAGRTARDSQGVPALASGRAARRVDRRAAHTGYLAPAPILEVEKIDPQHAAPPGDVPGPSLPAGAGGLPRSAHGSAPVLPPVTDVSEARAPAASASPPAASTVAPAAPPSASISIQALDDSSSTASTRSAPPSPPVRPATLRDALQHEQMAAYYHRQGDDQAAYSEYQYARDLFRKVQQRGGQEAAVAAQGAAAAQYGMSRLQAP